MAAREWNGLHSRCGASRALPMCFARSKNDSKVGAGAGSPLQRQEPCSPAKSWEARLRGGFAAEIALLLFKK